MADTLQPVRHYVLIVSGLTKKTGITGLVLIEKDVAIGIFFLCKSESQDGSKYCQIIFCV